MGSENKGGVVFGYFLSNPWHGRDSLKMPKADAPSDLPIAVAAVTPTMWTTEISHAADLKVWFSEAPDYDVDDYAQPSAHGLGDVNVKDASVAGGGHTEDETMHAAMPGRARRRIIFV